MTAGGSARSRAVISCVTEPGPEWVDKVYNLVLSVRTFGGSIAQAPIVVNVVGDPSKELVRCLAGLDVTTRTVAPVDPRSPAANKLRMLELAREIDVGVLVAVDCDLVITGDIGPFLDDHNVRAAYESHDQFTAEQWGFVYRSLGLQLPERDCVMTSTGRRSFPYFNSGVLFVPGAMCGDLLERWGGLIGRFNDLCDAERDRAPRRWFADQVALACAVIGHDLPLRPLPPSLNLHTKLRIHKSLADEVRPPFIVHYHGEITDEGYLRATRTRTANQYVHRFNAARAAALGRSYSRLPRPALARRVQTAMRDHEWYQSRVVKQLRHSRMGRTIKKMAIG